MSPARLTTARWISAGTLAAAISFSGELAAQTEPAPAPTTSAAPAATPASTEAPAPDAKDGASKDAPKASKKRPGATPPEDQKPGGPRTDLKPGEKRQAQDYDGREDVTTTAEDALWVPRIILFPVYIVVETFVRLPLGAITVAVEQNDVIGELENFFTFGPDNNIGIVPTAFVDFGFRPSVGLYMFWNDFIAEGNDLRVSLGFGGQDYLRAGVANRIPIDTPIGTERAKSYVQLEFNALRRSDLSFWGIGPRTDADDEGGYSVRTYGGGARAHIEPWRGTFVETWVTARATVTGAGDCPDQISIIEGDSYTRYCSTPTIRSNIQTGVYEAPPHYGRPYTTVKSGIRGVLDSRDERPAPGHGVAIDVNGELVTDVEEPKLGAWINYGATLAGFVDLTETQRVLSLTIAARFQDELNDKTTIPFTELVGSKHIEDVPDLDVLRGFLPGRLLGSSAISATLEYRWPIWAFIDGTLQAGVGNTFDEPHLEDFDPELLRFSFVGGLRSPNHRDHSFNLLVGFGTDPFIDGGAPSSFRFLIGGTTGF